MGVSWYLCSASSIDYSGRKVELAITPELPVLSQPLTCRLELIATLTVPGGLGLERRT